MDKLEVTSPQHRDLYALVSAYVKAGKGALAGRHGKWKEAEKTRKAYINLKATDEARKTDAHKDGSAGYPGAAPIVVPISYAMNMTTLSYLMSIFSSRSPIIPIIGGGDDSEGARKMEVVLQYQMSQCKYLLKLYLWFQDVLDYGIGVSYNYWDVKTVPYIADANQMGMAGMMSGMLQKMGLPGLPVRKTVIEGIGYEGNNTDVIDPYNIIIDPRFPLTDYEKGDFFGFQVTMSINSLIKLEEQGKVYNIAKVKDKSNTAVNTSTSTSSRRDTELGGIQSSVAGGKGTTAIDIMFVKLIPSEYNLGEYNSIQIYEIWIDTRSETIIRAEAMTNIHGSFPVSILEYNPDGHSLFNIGQSELLSGLQSHVSWLFNSHMDNVRKSLNDMLVVDPSRVNMSDLTDPNPGKLIRLNELAYGQDVRSIITQLNVADVTQGHLQKVSIVIDLMQRVSAATDNMMGLPNFGRRTATEIRNIQTMAGGRMKMFAEVCHAMGLMPQHRQFITNTQQYLTQTKAYQIMGEGGDYSKVAQVAPADILGQFDIPPADGTLPTDRLALADIWKELFNIVVGSPIAPVLMQKFNVVAWFEQIANLMGVKDLNRFVNQMPGMGMNMTPQVMDDGMIDEQVRQGNMVPLQNALGNDNPSQYLNNMTEEAFEG